MNALVIVDVQTDFFPGGPLPVKTAPEILPALKKLLKLPFDLVVASKDWHPIDHVSFAKTHGKNEGERVLIKGLEQILWPVHCVQNTPGADFYPGWDTKKIGKVFYKGSDKWIDSYSAFFDNNHEKSTGLADHLQEHKIDTIYVSGLCTDYCVRATVLDACKLGLKTYVVQDACAGVDPEDSQKALDEMVSAGAYLTTSNALNIKNKK